MRKNKKSEYWLDHEGLQALFFAVKIHYHHLLKIAIVVELVVVGDFDGGPVFFFVLGLECELGSLRLTPLSLPFVFNNLLSTWLDMFGVV